MLSECRLQPKQASTEGENDSRFLVVSQNSRGVTGSELHRPPTSPRGPPDPTPVAAPPAQSHSTTYTHAGPYCTVGQPPITPLTPSFLVEACSLSRREPQEGRALICLLHCCTPRRTREWPGAVPSAVPGARAMAGAEEASVTRWRDANVFWSSRPEAKDHSSSCPFGPGLRTSSTVLSDRL